MNTPPDDQSRKPTRRRWGLAGCALVALFLVILGVLLISSSGLYGTAGEQRPSIEQTRAADAATLAQNYAFTLTARAVDQQATAVADQATIQGELEQTLTAVAIENATSEQSYNQTVTASALEPAYTATAFAILEQNLTQTATAWTAAPTFTPLPTLAPPVTVWVTPGLESSATSTRTKVPEASPPSADSDGDGVPDSADACPAYPGSAQDNGCPVTPSAASTNTPDFAPSVTPSPTPSCEPPPGWLAISVAPGDTLFEIALHSGTTVDELIQVNCLVNSGLIAVGQTLYVPPLSPTPAATDTPPPTPISLPPTQVAVAYLGDGEVRVYAPLQMALGETSEVRVEIEFKQAAPQATIIWNPPPTFTPVVAVGTPRPTPTALPLVGGGYVPFYERMAAHLRGVDLDHFKTEAHAMSDTLAMNPNAINWWKWTIKPVGKAALGKNALEVRILVPETAEGGPLTLLNTIPFTVEVTRDGAPVPDQEDGSEGGLIALVAVIVAAGGGLVLGGWWLRHRARRSRPLPALVPVESKPPRPPIAKADLRLFISYSRRDRKFVDRLVADLEAENVYVWRDVSDIPAGSSWDAEIQGALNTCTHVLLVASPSSVVSPNVADEISFALDKGKLVIPLMIADCELPLRVHRAQWIDFRADYDRGLRDLFAQLHIR